MRDLIDPRTHLFDEPARTFNLSKGPQRQRQLHHHAYTGVMPEAEC